MSGFIYLTGVQAFARLGIYENERKRGQAIFVDVTVALDMSKACTSDNMEDSISYVDISHIVQNVAKAKEYNLIEHLSECIANELFAKLPKIASVDLRVYKPVINADGFNGNASVRIYRERA